VHCDDKAELKKFEERRRKDLAKDKDGKLVYLAESAWGLQTVQENHPAVEFRNTSE